MTPQQAETQRQIALEKANRVRIAMARFKLDCRDATSSAEVCAMVADILRNPDAGDLEAMKIRHLLQCIPLIGDVKISRFLCRADIFNSDRPLRRLTVRQRHLLAFVIEQYASDRQAA